MARIGERQIGESVTLTASYRGYRNAEIVDYEHPRYKIKFYGSGLTLWVYEDELE